MVELELEQGVARLRLNRPQARNAISVAGWAAIAERAQEAARHGARLLVVEGVGGSFSAGADLSEFPRMSGDVAAAAAFRTAMRRGIEAVAALPLATIALVEGPCYGAAVALALACDLRLAGPGARFAITPAKIGISYPQEDLARLVAAVGSGAAARLVFTGEAVGADEALAIGLADGRADELDALAAAILASDRASLATLKRGLRLAAAGIAADPEQDRAFDALLSAEALAGRLAARRRR